MITNTSLKKKKKKKNNRLEKKNHLKNQQKKDVSNFNEWVNERERNINSEIFQRHSKLQRPSAMLKSSYKTNDNK